MQGFSNSKDKTQSVMLVTSWCHFLRQDLSVLFQEDMILFLEKLPAILVDEAERLPSSHQQKYFDIVTLINSNKELMQAPLKTAVPSALDNFTSYLENNKTDKAENLINSNSLSLIDTDEIEVGIVTEGQAGRIASKINEVLNDAYLRISQLIPIIQTSSQLPCHPKALITCMLDSLSFLELNTNHKILLVKHFAQFISVEKLNDIIAKSLKNANIPEFNKQILNQSSDSKLFEKSAKLKQEKNDSAPSKPNKEEDSPTKQKTTKQKYFPPKKRNDDLLADSNAKYHSLHKQLDDMNDKLTKNTRTSELANQFDYEKVTASNAKKSAELLNQLGNLRALRSQMASTPITPKAKNPLVTEQVLSPQEIDSILVDLQKQQSTESVTINNNIQSVSEVRNLIKDQLVSNESTVQKIDNKESDIINLISMLFDEILDNPNLSTEMKALLARLQIPVLRVGLMTPDFISQTQHPSRKLLEKLAESGVSWDKSNKKDKFFDQLESYVFRILKEFQSDQHIFAKIYNELIEFLSNENQKTNKIEERTLEKEKKKAESQLAKSEVQKQLNERLVGKKIPFCVVKLIQNGWWQVLYHTNIRYGIESAQWNNGLKIVDGLVWSVNPPNNNNPSDMRDWQDQLEKIQTKLINNIKVGLNHINFDTLQLNQLVDEIQQIHQDLLENKEIVLLDIKSSDKSADLDQQFTLDQKADNIALPKESLSAIQNEQQEEIDNEELNEIISQIQGLNTGDWIEFDSDTAAPKRHKLVARIRTLNKLVFTNRRGIKVAEISNTKLAKMILNAKAKILTIEEHLVDKALYSVFDNVEKIEATQ